MYNVEYEMRGKTLHYLASDVPSISEAQRWADRFNARYYNRRMPGGDVYPVSEAKVVQIVEGRAECISSKARARAAA